MHLRSNAFSVFLSATVGASAAFAQITPSTYDVRLLAQTGDATTSGVLTSIDPYVSINDAGWLAFSGSDSVSSRCFVWKFGVVQGVTFANPNRLFEGAAINNQVPPWVASRDRITSGTTTYYERLWPSDGSQLDTLVGASPTDFDSGQLNLDLNDLGVMCFVANVNGGSSTALFAGAAQPPNQLRVYPGFPPLRPAISNTNVIVIREPNGDVSGVQYPSGAALAYSAGGGFTATGRKPGISADGRAVAFVGAQGGPEGIFVSLQASTGQSLHRIAGGGADAFTDFLDAERVGVVSTGDTFLGQTFTVVFLGTLPNESGLYALESTALETAGVVTVTSKAPRRVVKIGSSVGGKTIASLSLHDSPNATGSLGFYAAFTDGTQGVLRASPELDTDGDALFDSWETMGIDFNDDGTVDLHLPALGAKEDHKDLFVEIDAMAGRAPLPATIDRVVAAFADAPNSLVNNPDGTDGVALHYLIDETNILLTPWIAFDPATGWPNGFDPVKAAWFGTAAERGSSKWKEIKEARRLVYRYCVFADQLNDDSSGVADGVVFGAPPGPGPGGNDLIVTLGHPNWGLNGGTIGGTADQQAGTFMHELGHTLGLRHGGLDDDHNKPNQHSTMNYSWQLPANHNSFWWGLDYSRAAFNPLNEASLDESTGIGGSDPAVFVVIGPKPEQFAAESGPVNWDRDNTLNENGVAADINFVLANNANPGQQLASYVEWSSLVYGFRDSTDFADGVHATSTALDELTASDHLAAQALCPTPGVYCSAKVNSLGCTPQMTITGSTSLSGPDDLVITVDQVLNGRRGVVLWSRKSGLQAFGGGTLCIVGAQLRALPIGSSGGTTLPALDCSGVYTAPFTHAYMASQGIGAGDMIFAQCWSRDPGFAEPDNIGLSAAVAFLVCP